MSTETDRERIRAELIQELSVLPVHMLTTNQKEIVIRCPDCGDSRKHGNHGHRYINIDIHSDRFLQNYCQRCKSKGYTDYEFLKSLKIHNQTLALEIQHEIKTSNSKKRGYRTKKLYKKNLIIPTPDSTDKINRIKLQYLCSRIGNVVTYDTLQQYKIILNLYDLLDANKISYISCKEKLADTLDNNFIGFISYDNNYITMRNLSKKILPDIRYHNYSIYGDYDNTKKFYIIPTKVSIFQECITVVLTEGVFDILNVYFNIDTDHKNKIYCAVCGIGYNLVIQEIIRMGFLQIKLIIYGDNDQDIDIYRGIITDNVPFIQESILYTNKIAKDFGNIKDGYEIKKTLLHNLII